MTVTYKELGLDMDEVRDVYRPYTIRPSETIDVGRRKQIIEVGFEKGSYADFYASRGKKFQQNVVGPVRQGLISDGDINFKDLVNLKTGRLLRLDELGFTRSGGPLVSPFAFISVEKGFTKEKILSQIASDWQDSYRKLFGRAAIARIEEDVEGRLFDVYTCKYKQKLAGLVTIYKDKNKLIIDTLVSGDLIGIRGVGTRLMVEIAKIASKENIPLKLWPAKDARIFYEKLGMKEVGRSFEWTAKECEVFYKSYEAIIR